MNNEKCLLVSNMYPGAGHTFYGVFVKNIVDRLEILDLKFDKVVITGRGRTLLSKLLKYSLFYCKIFFLALFNKYKLVYVHYLNYSSLPLQLVIRLKEIRLVFNLHGSDLLPKTRLGKLLLAVNRNLLIKASLIIVPSSFYKKLLLKDYYIDENKIFVSPSGGVDCELFRPVRVKRDSSIICIGYVSRIDQGKGWEILLNAVERLYTQGDKNFRLIVAGSGKESAKFQNMLKGLTCQQNIEYLGSIQQDKLVDIYNQMDVFIFPSYRKAESLGLVGLEAMACGIPVIGSNMGGLTEYICEGINGYYFEPMNVNSLYCVIKRFMLLNKEEHYLLSYNARKTALHFDRKIVIDKLYNRIYNL